MKVHIKKKGKILIMNFSGKEKVDIMDIMDLIQRKNVVERWYFLSIYETSMTF